MDPVSKKELDRAIEVNKIQGNRNPFIDYPELAEYIWGEKQGEAVDFTKMQQSYGDEYSEEQALDDLPVGNTARKEIREGKVVIIRNASEYTVLGQPIK